MIKPLYIDTEYQGSDERTTIHYAIDDFLKLEQGTRLRQIYEYWTRLPCNENGLPEEKSFFSGEKSSKVTSVMGAWIDTRSEDPMDFIIRDHAECEFPGYGIEFSDEPLISFPDSLHAFSCMMDYLLCKIEREPIYHEIHQRTGGIKWHYTRIMLPVDGENGNVARIYYAVRSIIKPKRVIDPVVDFEKT